MTGSVASPARLPAADGRRVGWSDGKAPAIDRLVDRGWRRSWWPMNADGKLETEKFDVEMLLELHPPVISRYWAGMSGGGHTNANRATDFGAR
jgi:hypothetical protein